VVGFVIGHRDGANSCLLYRPSKGSNSVVKFSSGLDGKVEVESGVKGMSVKGSFGMFVIVECFRCGEVCLKVNFEY